MKMNEKRGITLVALVITIVILLILAGISISTLTNTGIFARAQEAKEKSEEAQQKESSTLYAYEDELNKYTSNDRWDGKVNKPELMTGMKAIKFTDPTDSAEGTAVKNVDSSKSDWYNYANKQWANAQTEDGSMWVWIPRYAYKINSDTHTFDIVFLVGTSDNYYDKDGKLQTAKRQTSENDVPDAKVDYVVHPAFTNESSINYVNGGWKKELAGIWVAKFEAGYFDKTTENSKIKPSSVTYSQTFGWTTANKNEDARNYYDGIYGTKSTKIKYPTFQGLKYSMNYINHSDAFSISRALTEKDNVYGLSSSSTDSHLMKNSEWGAVAYLGQSKYGLGTEEIRINNVNLNNETDFVYASTGYAAKEKDASAGATSTAYKWYETEGATASCTGTIDGIYDLSGGTWERTAAIVNNGNSNLNTYGKAIMNELNNGKSSAYVTAYSTSGSTVYGDAVRETSIVQDGQNLWYSDYSIFPTGGAPFFMRGGDCWNNSKAGLFCFSCPDGNSLFTHGFRSVLVSQ